MPVDKFDTAGLLALAKTVTDGEDEKYKQFIKLLEGIVSENE
ncbi:hypothetical protein LSPCS325_16290 [Lysinibacillus sp. CTST325]